MRSLFFPFQMLCQARTRRPIMVIGVLVTLFLLCQTFTLPSRIDSFRSPASKASVLEEEEASITSFRVDKLTLLFDSRNSDGLGTKGMDEYDYSVNDTDDFDGDGDTDTEFSFDLGDDVMLKKGRDPVGGLFTLERVVGQEHNASTPAVSNINASSQDVDMSSVIPYSGGIGTDKDETVSVSEMNRLLQRGHASYRSLSMLDKEMLAAKAKIDNAPIVKADRQLYLPLFRNISTFRRSYELMEKTLKVYVYKEGQKPIFHEPPLRGIYASEGWFMKQMEMNRKYVVKDPRKAHLFYIPYSSKLLQFAVYHRNSRNWRDLDQHLRNYVDLIASKYPFWNRTGGADHFIAACHDWAPNETRHTMERTIRALCVADLRKGFRPGKDVSLPETSVGSPKNPLRGLGGKPADRRPILAFFAGNLQHGRLRRVLLKHWEDKDPDMKIFGLLPPGAGKRTAYVRFMKNSRYCLCPRGHEVSSPRVVESIFFECVPVILSDNYVLPFFETLDWEAFSVVVPEKDVPRLKEILTSIPEEKYLALQKGVRRVQQHFLWHTKPVKYDLFHMILHSIWFSRVNNIRTG